MFRRDGRCEVKPYGDGFLLVTHRDGATGFRHWQLDGDVGEITTSGDNEVATVRVRRAAGGAVELPDPAVVDETGGDLGADGLACAGCRPRRDTRGRPARASPRRRSAFPLGAARSVGLGRDDGGQRARPGRRPGAARTDGARRDPHPRRPVHGHAPGRLRARELGRPRDRPARGASRDAELVLDPDGVATALEVHDVEEGEPLRPTAGEPPGALWVDWPCDVTATRWEAEARTGGRRALRPGRARALAPARERRRRRRLGRGRTPRARRAARRRGSPSAAGSVGWPRRDEPARPVRRPHAVRREPRRWNRSTLSSAAGEEAVGAIRACPARSGSVGLVFGDPETGPFVEVTSTTVAEERELRRQAAAELAILDRPGMSSTTRSSAAPRARG